MDYPENIYYHYDPSFFINKIKNGEHFRYARYSDGELRAIIGDVPYTLNLDKHQFFPHIGVELEKILLDHVPEENYFLVSHYQWYNAVDDYRILMHRLVELNPKLRFLHYDFIRTLHEQNPEEYLRFLELLKTKKLIIVGPPYMLELKKYFKFKYIGVPLIDCYLQKDKIINAVNELADKVTDTIFLFSASMVSVAAIDQCHNGKNSYLDWGSVWDTFFISPKYRFIRKRSTSKKRELMEKYRIYWI